MGYAVFPANVRTIVTRIKPGLRWKPMRFSVKRQSPQLLKAEFTWYMANQTKLTFERLK